MRSHMMGWRLWHGISAQYWGVSSRSLHPWLLTTHFLHTSGYLTHFLHTSSYLTHFLHTSGYLTHFLHTSGYLTHFSPCLTLANVPHVYYMGDTYVILVRHFRCVTHVIHTGNTCGNIYNTCFIYVIQVYSLYMYYMMYRTTYKHHECITCIELYTNTMNVLHV